MVRTTFLRSVPGRIRFPFGRHRLTLISLLVAGALTGCSFYLGKPKLEGEVRNSGLLLIDCGVKNRHGTNWLEDMAGFGWADLTGGTVQSSNGSVYEGKELKNLIVISGLPVGTYTLSRIDAKKTYRDGDAETFHFRYNIPAAFADSLLIQIGVGKPTYVGKLVIDERHDASEWPYDQENIHLCENKDIYSIETDSCSEIEALRMFLKYYEKSAWAGPVRSRLERLAQSRQTDCD